MTKQFHHFKDGYKIDDFTINKWIDQCIGAVKNGLVCWGISSGDTMVTIMEYDTGVQVTVSNSDGYSRIMFYKSDEDYGEFKYSPYVRPVSLIEKDLPSCQR